MSEVIELQNRQHWEHILNTHKAVIVDVWLESCNPCKILAPKFQQLANDFKYPGIAFVTEDNKMGIHPVTGVPSILFFLHGKPFETILEWTYRE